MTIVAPVDVRQAHGSDVVIEHDLEKRGKIKNVTEENLKCWLTSLFNLMRAMSLLNVLLTKSGLMNTWEVSNDSEK